MQRMFADVSSFVLQSYAALAIFAIILTLGRCFMLLIFSHIDIFIVFYF